VRIFHITTTDLLLGFSDGDVPKVDGLYIGLTKLQPLLRHFHELFLGVTKVEGKSQETASPVWSRLQDPATETQRAIEASRVRSVSRTFSLERWLGRSSRRAVILHRIPLRRCGRQIPSAVPASSRHGVHH